MKRSRRTKSSRLAFACAVTLALSTGLAAAVQAEPRGPHPPVATATSDLPPARSEALRREILQRLASERAWKLVEGLKLDQATSAKVFPVLTKYDELFFTLFGERRELGRQLRAEMGATTPNDAHLTAVVDKLVALRARRHALENDRLTELRMVLTPWQQARLITLLPQIEGGFLRRIRHSREEEGPGGPAGGRGPEGRERSDGHEGELRLEDAF